MNIAILIWIGAILLLLTTIYFRFIHFKIKFTDSKYMKNKKLLELDYHRLNDHAYHLEITGFSFIVAGLTVLDKTNISGVTLSLGLLFLVAALIHDGRSERRYHWLRELIKKS